MNENREQAVPDVRTFVFRKMMVIFSPCLHLNQITGSSRSESVAAGSSGPVLKVPVW